MVRRFQQVGDKQPDRTDHVWRGLGTVTIVGWKCVLCGGVTNKTPPFYPTPTDWVPEKTEKLTDEERAMCPNLILT